MRRAKWSIATIAGEIGRVVSPETARTVAQMLTGVRRQNGTALEAAIEASMSRARPARRIKLMDEIAGRRHDEARLQSEAPHRLLRRVLSRRAGRRLRFP